MHVISRPWALLVAALALTLSSSCTGRYEGPIAGDLEVLLPWASENGAIQTQPVRLRGIDDLARLRGRFGHFEVDSVWTSEGTLEGEEPRAKFVRDEGGVFIPMDERSARLAILYAHLDRLAALEEALGLGALSPDPLRVAVDVDARAAEGPWVDNALYDHQLDALLFAPDRDARVPLTTNPGIVAHERFHALFARLAGRVSPHRPSDALDSVEAQKPGGEEPMRRPQPVKPEEIASRYREVFWHALNEGMADLWGWLYSGDPEFMKRSLPVRGEGRRLSAQRLSEIDLEWLSGEKLKAEIARRSAAWSDPDLSARRFSYEVATQFARKSYAELVKVYGNTPSREERAEIAARLLGTLKKLVELRESSVDAMPDLGGVVKSLTGPSEPVETEL